MFFLLNFYMDKLVIGSLVVIYLFHKEYLLWPGPTHKPHQRATNVLKKLIFLTFILITRYLGIQIYKITIGTYIFFTNRIFYMRSVHDNITTIFGTIAFAKPHWHDIPTPRTLGQFTYLHSLVIRVIKSAKNFAKIGPKNNNYNKSNRCIVAFSKLQIVTNLVADCTRVHWDWRVASTLSLPYELR